MLRGAIGWNVEDTSLSILENESDNVCKFRIRYHLLWDLTIGDYPLGYKQVKTYLYTLSINEGGESGSLSWTEV